MARPTIKLAVSKRERFMITSDSHGWTVRHQKKVKSKKTGKKIIRARNSYYPSLEASLKGAMNIASKKHDTLSAAVSAIEGLVEEMQRCAKILSSLR
jgi:hypothetical protein